ncbi:hypothetical protein KIN20_010110 [Parelaphostrongylus tenuis]|uniref:Uncharacterized protein n=1 Tax=Parelaphostrongylus tenuis TaxID=148309 RepID=A0AAD5QK34_PARTN|nr:hypothetical protein KIN20_010110 [Parelaphostrongylus tenuis]
MQPDNGRPHTAEKTKENFDELDGVEGNALHFPKSCRFETSDEIEEACQESLDLKLNEWSTSSRSET